MVSTVNTFATAQREILGNCCCEMTPKKYLDEFVPVKKQFAPKLLKCLKKKECGHKCQGVKDETTCLPCLEPECIAAREQEIQDDPA